MNVATARPLPLPIALPAAAPASAPNAKPAPDLGASVVTVWPLHTYRGTAICSTTGVLEITRPVISTADAFMPRSDAAAAESKVNVEMSLIFIQSIFIEENS
jgi:hypothetical protein